MGKYWCKSTDSEETEFSLENLKDLNKQQNEMLFRINRDFAKHKIKLRSKGLQSLRMGTVHETAIGLYNCPLSSFLRNLEVGHAKRRNGEFVVRLDAIDYAACFLEELQKRGISDSKIHETLGLSSSGFYKIRRGKTKTTSFYVVMAMALFLRMEVSDFVEKCEEMKMKKLGII